jgi:FkbM family methyltransferase
MTTTLVYVGAFHGHSAVSYLDKHDRAILVEPNPSHAALLRERFHGYKGVEIVEAAVSAVDGGIAKLHLYGPHGGSASILEVTRESAAAFQLDIDAPTAVVCTIRLDEELQRRGVETIDTLVTDAQGMDLEVLVQLRPWLERGIKHVQCEVDALGFRCYWSERGNAIEDFDRFFASLPLPYCRVTEVCGSHIDCVWELEEMS